VWTHHSFSILQLKGIRDVLVLVMDTAAMNIHVHVFWYICICISLGHLYRNILAVLVDIHVFNSCRYCQTVYTVIASTSRVVRVLSCQPLMLILIYLIFLWDGGSELRALCLQSRCFFTWATPLVHFALVILEIESHKLLAWLTSNCNPPDFSLPSSSNYRSEPLAPG
jgi:hypothetical protein